MPAMDIHVCSPNISSRLTRSDLLRNFGLDVWIYLARLDSNHIFLVFFPNPIKIPQRFLNSTKWFFQLLQVTFSVLQQAI